MHKSYFLFYTQLCSVYGPHLEKVSLGPHCAYFRIRKFKPQIEKLSTVCVEKIFTLVAQHSERKCELSLS